MWRTAARRFPRSSLTGRPRELVAGAEVVRLRAATAV